MEVLVAVHLWLLGAKPGVTEDDFPYAGICRLEATSDECQLMVLFSNQPIRLEDRSQALYWR